MLAPRSRPTSALGGKRAPGHASKQSITAHPGPSTLRQPTRQPSSTNLASSTSTNAASGSAKGKEPVQGNIEVVVRCRKLSAQEIAAASILVASSNPTRGISVTLTDPSLTCTSSSSLTSSTPQQPATKTYNFGGEKKDADGTGELVGGNVFGPEATQGMLFDDIVKPFLREVLAGFNCTIFAYGQTGTGKTYTMEGNLSSIGGTFHTQAGIIPRTLYTLFKRLEEEGTDFTVKCSYVELYNEELRDLNALESPDSPPVASTSSGATSQPMDKSTSASHPGLKIYEDKTGVNISGLNETFITSAEEGLMVLKRGSQRRQIAATKCNEQSSRSHSIFTITLHMKDATSKTGEEIVRIGKLNLVDLAGSESVGKSGAEGSRAKEAGMINVSLLALGRVINLLVQKQSHIPYRESKLTRLLQDSLGGRTKTCIIATISPLNFEETISTLDYALRAKSIMNRPEVNQRTVKGALMSQYAVEIEALKADLVAVREMNGMFFSEESWAKISLEQAALASSLSAIKTVHEVTVSELSTTREQFSQNLRLLDVRTVEVTRLGQDNRSLREEGVRMAAEIARLVLDGQLQRGLRDESSKKEALAKSEVTEARDDVEGLRQKLDRKHLVEMTNLKVVKAASTDLNLKIQGLVSTHKDLRTAHNDFVQRATATLSAFAERENQELMANSAFITEQLSLLSVAAPEIGVEIDTIQQQGDKFRSLVDATRVQMLELVELRAQQGGEGLKARVAEIEEELRLFSEMTTKTIVELSAPMEELHVECLALLKLDAASLGEAQMIESKSLAIKTHQLESTIAHLTAALHAQTTSSSALNAQLLATITATIESQNALAVRLRDETIEKVAAGIVERNTLEVHGIESRILRNEELEASNATLAQVIARGKDAVDGVVNGIGGDLASSVHRVGTDLVALQADVESCARESIEIVQAANGDLAQASVTFASDAARRHSLLNERLSDHNSQTQSAFEAVQGDLIATREDIETTAREVQQDLDDNAAILSAFDKQTSTAHKALKTSLVAHLSTSIVQDVPTGATPLKRLPLGSLVDKTLGKKKGIERTMSERALNRV